MSEMGSSMAKEVMDEYRRRSREPEAIPVVKIQEIAIDIADYIDNPYKVHYHRQSFSPKYHPDKH